MRKLEDKSLYVQSLDFVEPELELGSAMVYTQKSNCTHQAENTNHDISRNAA